jgi:flagella basal body P-ring formation protein FlgA
VSLIQTFRHIYNKRNTLRLLTLFIAAFAFFLLVSASPLVHANGNQNTVTHDNIISALDQYIKSGDFYSGIPYRIYTKQIIDNVTADKNIEIRIIDRNRGKVLKSDNFQAVLISDGKTIRRFELRAFIGIEVSAAIASRDLRKGEKIGSAIEFRYVDLTGESSRTPIYQGDQIPDSVVKVNLQSGRIIDSSLLEMPDLIRRGQRVIVFSEIGSLSISMVASALESGKLGDEIKVLNESSGKTLLCIITGEGETEIR